MVRTIRCLLVALLTASIAHSAPPPETVSASHSPRIRFLSLAEARAIALERGNLDRPPFFAPLHGLPNDSEPRASGPIQVLACLGKKGLVLTGIPSGPRRDEYERNINQTLLNVETAYWNLYGSYWQLHSREQGLRLAYETWKTVGDKYRAGEAGLASFAQAQGQYELFRSQRLQALDTALDNERQLRAILSMPTGRGVRLVPSDAPTLKEKKPDWEKALSETLKNRPELHIARAALPAAVGNYLFVKNIVLPILRIIDPKACAVLDNWSPPIGLRLLPVDYLPPGPPCLRQAHLQVLAAHDRVSDQELKAERFLGLEYRRMASAYSQIKAARVQREVFATHLRLRAKNYDSNAKDAALDLVLEAQRFWADALATEYNAIVTYNNAICGWEYAKGSIMAFGHIRLGEEAEAGGKKVRAVVREHRRTANQVRRQPGVAVDSPLNVPGANGPAPSLPALWKSFPPLRDAEALPPIEDNVKAAESETRPTEWKASDIFPSRSSHAY